MSDLDGMENAMVNMADDHPRALGTNDMIALQKKKGRGMIGWGRGFGRVSRDAYFQSTSGRRRGCQGPKASLPSQVTLEAIWVAQEKKGWHWHHSANTPFLHH